jgi:CheY-like chemotaxis protein/HPt (histidine-containing phosphotransfer) domain-containing protein
LIFRVSDTGIGIAAEAMSRLFKSFSQADGSTTRKYGGTGLGLVISKELCDLMGGSIEVASKAGAWTVFTVKLPLRKALNPVPVSVEQYSDLKGKSVLIVEDNPASANIMANYLTSFGMHYQVAENSAQGLEMLDQAISRGQNFDGALLGINDVELCQHIRQNSRFANMPMVIITSSDREDELGQIQACDCNLYLNKPLRKRVLQDALKKLLAKKSASKPIQGCLQGIRVLLAEDNPVNQKLATAMLGVLGCHVTTANDGLEAVEIFKQGKIDLVLMDCMMPKMDGYNASQEIRNYEKVSAKQSIPILALTANAMEGDRERCLAAGMNDYLSKPFLLEAFHDKISRLLQSKSLSVLTESTPPSLPSQGSVKFDPAPLASMRKMGGDKLVEDLLQLFYNNTPQLLEKLQLGLSARDAEAVRQSAHSLKSAAANLGAFHLTELARDLEHAARNGSLTFDNQQVVTMKNEYEEVCQIIAKHDWH